MKLMIAALILSSNSLLTKNAGKAMGVMDDWEKESCALGMDSQKRTVALYFMGGLDIPFKTYDFDKFTHNPITNTLTWSEFHILPPMTEKVEITFDNADKAQSFTRSTWASWENSKETTCLLNL